MFRTFWISAAGRAVLLLLIACTCAQVQAQIIRTVAGGGKGDGGPATNAELHLPSDVALDGSGNLFIADTYNSRIRKVDTNGVITTVAGTGIPGYSGDDGPAARAQLYQPEGVAVDASGNLYIADTANSRIRKIDTNGVITTIAGIGVPLGPPFLGDGGPAINAALRFPYGVAVDSLGNVYIADTDNARVRKVDTNGVITTFAGNGIPQSPTGDGGPATNAGLEAPTGVVINSSGNLYIADANGNRVRKVDSNGVISTVAGNGIPGFSGDGSASAAAQLDSPSKIAIDASGNLYIADSGNNRIRKVMSNGVITTVAGNGISGFSGDGGAATSAELANPFAVAVDAGTLYIGDANNDLIRKVDTNGGISTFAGNGTPGFSGDGGAATNANLDAPGGVAIDGAGNVYIADSLNNRIRKVATNGVITTIAGNGAGAGANDSGGFSGDGGPATSAELYHPLRVAVDSVGNLYIVDYGNHRIRKVALNGIITTIAGNGDYAFSGDGGLATSAGLGPTDVAIDAPGNLYIADYYNQRIRKVDTNGFITTVAGNGIQGFSGDGGAATSAELHSPEGIAVDTFGNLYVADYGNNRIRKVDASSVITTVAGNGTQGISGDGGPATSAELAFSAGVAVDAFGNLYIVDNGGVRKVATNGTITRFAGAYRSSGFGGDGGVATSAFLCQPQGVVVDTSGNLYIADACNGRVREVLPEQIFKNGFE